MFKYIVKICVNILVKDLDLALFFILDIKTEKIIEKCAIFDFGFGSGFVFHIGYQDRIIKTKLSRQNYQDKIIKTENMFFCFSWISYFFVDKAVLIILS